MGAVCFKMRAVTCVNVLQATQHLVQKKLMMLWRQIIICFDDLCPGNMQDSFCDSGICRMS